MLRNRMFGAQRCRKDKSELVLTDGIAYFLFIPGLGAAIGKGLKPKSGLIKMGGLFGIAHVKFNMIRTQ